jgi:MFS family permease
MADSALTLSRTTTRSNFRHLYADIAWFGLVAGSTMAFLNIYAARIGAASFHLGLLAAGPAIINLLFSLPSGRWLENRNIIMATFWSSIMHRFGYLLLIPLPWLFNNDQQILVIILITLLMSLPGTLLAIAFNAMFADIIPPEQRANVVGRRNVLVAISVTVTTLICGQILDYFSQPLNYQIVFGIGVVGSFMSSYHLKQLRKSGTQPTERIWQPTGDLGRPGMLRFVDALRQPTLLRFLTRSQGKPLLRLELLKAPFGPFLVSYFLFYTFQFLPLPIFPLFLVRELLLTDGAISLGTALFYAFMVAGSLRLGYISARLGHRRVLIWGALMFCVYPLLVALSRDATLFWIASAIGGLVWAFLGGGLVNRLMERVPEGDRPAHMALHNLALNLGILLGSLAGPLLGEWVGLRDALLIGTALRFLGALILIRWS